MPGSVSVLRYYPPISDLIGIDIFSDPGHPLHFIHTLLNGSGLFGKLHYKDLQFSKSATGDSAFYSLKLVSNTRIAFEVFNSGISLIINKDNLDSNISALPLIIEYEWKVLKLIKAFLAANPYDTAEKVLDILFDILQLSKGDIVGNAINSYASYDPGVDTIAAFEGQLAAKYPAYTPIAPGSTNKLDDIAANIEAIQPGFTVNQAMYALYIEDNDVNAQWENLNRFFRLLINQDVKDYALDFIIPKIKVRFDLTGHVEVPRKWLQPMQELPAGSGNWVLKEEYPSGSGLPKASFSFVRAKCFLDSQRGGGLDIDFELSSDERVMLGKTGIQLQINTLKVDVRDDRNIPEADLDGRPHTFNGVYIKEAIVAFPQNWNSQAYTNLVVSGKDVLIGNEGGVSGTFSVAGQNVEVYTPFTIGGINAIQVNVTAGNVAIKDADQVVRKSVSYVLGKALYIRDESNHYYKVDELGKVSVAPIPNGGAPILQFDFANGMKIGLYSFHLELSQNRVVASSIVGQLSGGILENPVRVTLEFDEGFIIKAYLPNGQSIINNNTIEIKLNGLEFGKTNDQWQFGIAGRVDIKKAAPFVDRFLPTYFQLYRLFYSGATGFSYDLEAGWKNGMVVRGDDVNGIAAYIPINLGADSNSSGFKLKGINFKIKTNPNPEIEALMSGAGLVIGPVSAFVEDFGVKLAINETSEANADFGGVRTAISFVGPRGIEINVDAGPVSGSGFLYIGDHEYYGMFTLSIGKFGIGIIGILTTQLPTGNAGYSLLMIVAVEFGTIPIGFGFTLNGVGGLLGLHRTMNPDVLRIGIRDNTLDYILFPQDVNKGNVSSYISNIGQAFPVKEGQFMVGPMAKIGWGTPNILTIDLGIILEFPEPVRLAILGLLKAEWKAGEKSILKLQVNFLGIIDFTAKYLSFDASIFDSKILTFPLMGDMALRLYWGDKPNFLISVGGFHPRYTPPPLNLPELRRLSLVLADDKNLKVGIETYFAITSNSVQFGAKVMAEAKMWDGKINVLGALWFDILFKFNPFYFAADMGAQFAVRWKQKEILSIFINLMLEGPNPWRAQGKGTFKVIGIGVTVSFDKTFGKAIAATVDPAELDAQFAAQVAHQDNWEALLPSRSHQQVLWKEAAAAEGLIVDTGGQLRFSQKLLPLNIELSKFGTAPIKDTKRFELTSYELTQSGQTESFTTLSPAKDLFARGAYFNMTDDDKLSKDPYESFESGVFIGSDKFSSDYAVHRKVVYEDIVIDTGFREVKTNKWELSPELMQVHLLDSYVSKSVLSDFTTVGNSDAPPKVAAVNVTEERFVVVDRDSLAVMTDPFLSSAAAEHFLTTQMQLTNTAGNWIVANEFELV